MEVNVGPSQRMMEICSESLKQNIKNDLLSC